METSVHHFDDQLVITHHTETSWWFARCVERNVRRLTTAVDARAMALSHSIPNSRPQDHGFIPILFHELFHYCQ